MSSWFIAIIVIIITGWLLETGVTLLNLQSQPSQLPPEFADIYSAEKYQHSLQYQSSSTGCSLIKNTISTVALLLFLALDGFNYIDNIARNFNFGEIGTGLIFIGILTILSYLLGLPFQLYSTYVIEERFGFNKTTVKTFIIDTAKAALLSIVIGVPLLATIFWFFISTGSAAWLYCWIGLILFSFCIQLVAPVLIMPLFNKFSPLEDGTLKDRINDYAEKQHFTIQGVFTMDGSKRSSKLNAFFTGFGKLKKVVLFDTLISKLTTDQIIAVLAHEIGHSKCNHIYKGFAAFAVQSGIMFYLLSIILEQPAFSAGFGMQTPSIYSSLFFFGILYTPLSLLLSLVFNAISRKNEFEADSFAATTIGTGTPLITALKTLTKENLGTLSPHPLYVLFYYSHPPLNQRINALEKFSKINTL